MTGIGVGAVVLGAHSCWAGAPDAAVDGVVDGAGSWIGSTAAWRRRTGKSYRRVSALGREWVALDGRPRWPERECRPEWEREAESLDPAYAAEQRRSRSLVAFGVRLTWDVDDDLGPRLCRPQASGSLTSARWSRSMRGAFVLTLTTGEEITLHCVVYGHRAGHAGPGGRGPGRRDGRGGVARSRAGGLHGGPGLHLRGRAP